MSLPSPNLDDRKFQEIVNDVKQQIGRRCPEWTDHNVSDPGVTLIELFAYMTEMTLYRLNQVPEKNYIKFLEMIGVSLEPPSPALTDLRFRLSRPIEDQDGEEAFERTLRANDTVAATVRTETDEAVEFATDTDLRMVRPRLAHVLASRTDSDPNTLPGAREFAPGENSFPIFSPSPREGDALYLGFDADVSGNLIELEVGAVQSAAVGLDEDYPAQRWEIWDGEDSRWRALDIPRDTTYGFNRPPGMPKGDEPSGLIELAMPFGLSSRWLGGRRAYWVRCVYTPDLPPRGPERRTPAIYQKSPEIRSIAARTIGGSAPASNCSVIAWKDIGQSDGLPGQVFSLGHAPILPRRPGETVAVGEQGMPHAELDPWTEVLDFADSGPDDRHFVCDSLTGEIFFGPNVPQPDGSTLQHGAIPAKGLTVTFTSYRYGGGVRGNVAPDQLTVLKSSIPYVSTVSNPRRAEGGREQESLDRAKMRGQTILRMRDRAVTAEDYEYLARRASSGVGRAQCVQPRAVHDAGNIPPGVVRVLLVPSLAGDVPVPRPADLRVSERVRRDVTAYLDERRLLTTVLEVGEPDYVFVSTEITLVADPKADASQVRRSVQARLEDFIHPLRGGPNGDGWPFRLTLTLSDIYAQVQAAHGVAFLLDAKIFVSRLANAGEGLLTQEERIDITQGVRVNEHELLCTREHRIRVRPMSAVGTED
ncbi:putative baseplate assembly protein [Capsulimonas corticalis]|uniref:Baseplate assembly protein n=1 Tax=Capsulimonas corticalis TaxID=2219043 RepID=A0A402CWW1_9BACT|nr:putative baseplate assembly protein [Capsulimonas corticalis]BDI34265.1 putative baseplate assembly protein [Capsulimonas corticalis]